MDPLTIYELVAIAGVIIGTYIKLRTDIVKLESQLNNHKDKVENLENSNSEVSKMLKKLHDDLTEIKLLLARNRLDQ